MLWYLVQTAYQRYERWELKKQLKKLGINSIPSENLVDIAETVAKPLIADFRKSVDRETLLLFTHIAYGFTEFSDDEKEVSVAGVIEAMGYDDEDSRERTKKIFYALMRRWVELYPDFLPSEKAPVQ